MYLNHKTTYVMFVAVHFTYGSIMSTDDNNLVHTNIPVDL